MNSIAMIHVAKKQLGLDEDVYRAALKQATGKTSLRAMTKGELVQVVDHFKAKGFKVRRVTGKSPKAYVRLIFALWKSCAKLGVIDNGSNKALRAFVAGQTERTGKRIDDPNFLTYDEASPIIETLKSMEQRGKGAA